MPDGEDEMKCPDCKSSKTYKYGFRPKWVRGLSGHKKKLFKQAYLCDNCGHQWVEK
jgi:transposase-like protein